MCACCSGCGDDQQQASSINFPEEVYVRMQLAGPVSGIAIGWVRAWARPWHCHGTARRGGGGILAPPEVGVSKMHTSTTALGACGSGVRGEEQYGGNSPKGKVIFSDCMTLSRWLVAVRWLAELWYWPGTAKRLIRNPRPRNPRNQEKSDFQKNRDFIV